MPTTLLPPTPTGLAHAARALLAGQLVAMPTETVYGLAALASDPTAIAEVFRAKQRPADDPLIVHFTANLLADPDPVRGLQRLGLLAHDLSDDLADDLRRLATCWPGPLTLVVPRGPAVPDLVTSGLPLVALRMPAHPVAAALIDAVGHPLVAPSANRFGRISPTTAQAVLAELDGRIPYVLDGGPCAVGVESTVVLLLGSGRSRLLRPGGIAASTVEALLGVAPDRAQPVSGPAPAPGMSDSHYAPRTPTVLVDPAGWLEEDWRALTDRLAGAGVGWLAWTGEAAAVERKIREKAGVTCAARVLSPSATGEEAAQRLFGLMRELDELGMALIVVESCPIPDGLGEALRDRLRRACHGTPPLLRR
jgi:L-threonylcarbamoyladenylate synthase